MTVVLRLRTDATYFERAGERIAARLVKDFYRRWQRNGWNHRQANDALKTVQRKVEYWVGSDRAKVFLP